MVVVVDDDEHLLVDPLGRAQLGVPAATLDRAHLELDVLRRDHPKRLLVVDREHHHLGGVVGHAHLGALEDRLGVERLDVRRQRELLLRDGRVDAAVGAQRPAVEDGRAAGGPCARSCWANGQLGGELGRRVQIVDRHAAARLQLCVGVEQQHPEHAKSRRTHVSAQWRREWWWHARARLVRMQACGRGWRAVRAPLVQRGELLAVADDRHRRRGRVAAEAERVD
eukprot:6666392-Prymnesium_polylepis.1